MNTSPRPGIAHATLLTPDLKSACTAWRKQLAINVHPGTLDAADAAVLDLPDLAGAPMAWFSNCEDQRIVRVIEDPGTLITEPMFHHGWLALEILVGDIDALAATLRPPFHVLGAPANLELSDAIRAAQVLGPCGELLYLTQIKESVPPFDLPMTTAPVAAPFIGVISTPERTASQRAWSALLGADGWAFETKITVLNRAHGKSLDTRYPVAVVPMPGQCLVEIDQIELSTSTPPRSRAAGMYSLCLQLDQIDPDRLRDAGWRLEQHGHRYSLHGPAGEHVELRS